ncbi:methionine gamma-lyase [Proteinivorax hydrogeniformans]|uniref:L-methionine gamma-lyase n=2 Tax=Proteinivorax hydrogeniformans TaxID=1826727 RepID=A0AAU8HXA6_9FIRM
MIMTKKHDFKTLAVHAGQKPDKLHGALATPLYQTSTFVFDNVQQGANRFAGEESGYIYTRLGNPTQAVLEEKMAALEGGEAALAFGSGMAAVSAVLMYFLKGGDHVVHSDAIYGCTHSFLHEIICDYNVSATSVDTSDVQKVKEAIKPNTKAIYLETPANPTMKLCDIEAISKIAKEAGAVVIVDNTFMSPYLQSPLELGADVVLHSATKYIGGHGDVVAGILVGSKEIMDGIRMTTLKDIGGIIAPFDAWLLIRGLKTLAVRMDRTCENAQKVAEYLEQHPAVEKVHYPGLPSFPQHELAKKQMKGFSGLISFELKGGYDAGVKLMNSVKLCQLAVSLGDVDSLIQHPASMTHSVVPEEERLEAKITPGLVRLSVGIEDVEDIIEDLDQGIS